ncbi:unnamed protein product [Chondrus crispus]|uniref:AB hydrolase-1 domain-containing protein n=1 Tax=Chondrus crispus TaxID=2769 RepID=R7QN97_CHOCR|nr:unnamed protein product [Chondrus crispus]CDF39559.1 unnamed protein product [Chondrus crispus]|eukprot:XP_005709853.1 unnamed protein product [Chondrus crispus]
MSYTWLISWNIPSGLTPFISSCPDYAPPLILPWSAIRPSRPPCAMNLLHSLVLATGSVVGSVLAALYVFQEKLLYHPTLPTRRYEKKPDDYAMRYTDAHIVAADGVRIHAWLITQPRSTAAATFLYFHGNAGNLSHRLPDVRAFFASGFNVLMVSYRGYGESEGSPTEAGIKLDAAAALAYALDRSDVLDVSRLYLFGRSIGAACALAAAESADAQNSLRGIVVENTFTSIDDMIDQVMPAISFAKFLNRNKWNSFAAVGKIALPILFISGLKDELCPPDHMRSLHRNAEMAKFKVFLTIAEGTHNDTWWIGGSQYREAVEDFVRRADSEGRNAAAAAETCSP